MAKLTERNISVLACGPGQKDRLVFDDALPGLGVRVSATGAKSFLAQYTIDGQRRRVPIGRWGAITLDQARAAARAILGDVAKGRDPASDRTKVRIEAVAAKKAERLTFDVLLTEWEKLALAERRERYRNEALRTLRVAFTGFMDRPAAGLKRADVLTVLDGMIARGVIVHAKNTLAYGRNCFGWAQRRGMVADNPFLGLPIRTTTVSRDRVLTMDEVMAIWDATGRIGWPFGPLLRVLLLTAQRRNEVAEMRWSELSADRSTWTIPKERSKNGRAHIVHLTQPVRDILASAPRINDSPLVFTTTGKTPVSGFSRAKRDLDAMLKIEPWRLHDFRRTAVTWMAENGVPPHVADRILNHVQGTISGVAAVYQRGEFLAERRTALESWAGIVVG